MRHPFLADGAFPLDPDGVVGLGGNFDQIVAQQRRHKRSQISSEERWLGGTKGPDVHALSLSLAWTAKSQPIRD